ncbi:MAG: O-antigen polysaccharide polymerase Wzy [Bacteroides sp.]|nr:O-antigen polysaccharide polymerase Wzy [Bacteroides sp.]
MKNSAIKLILFCILIYLLYNYAVLPYTWDSSAIIEPLVLALFAFVIYFLRDERQVGLKGQAMTLSLPFLLGFIPTCMLLYILYSFDITTDLAQGYSLDYSVVTHSAYLSTIGFVSYLLGNVTCTTPYRIRKEKKEIRCNTVLPQRIAIVLFLIFFIFMDKRYFLGGYHELSNTKGALSPIAVQAQVFLKYLIAASIITTSWNIYNSPERKDLTIKKYFLKFSFSFRWMVIIYTILVIMSGDRDPLLTTLFLTAFSYILVKGIKIGTAKVAVLIILAAGLFWFLGYFRNTDFSSGLSSRLSYTFEKMSTSELGIWDIFDEYTRIIRTQHTLISYANQGHFLPIHGIVYPILGLIPGLGFLYTTILGIDQIDIVSSHIAKSAMDADHGMGTTCIADLYIIWGVTSVVIFMFLFGYITKKIERSVYQENISFFLWCAYLALLTEMVYVCRSNVFGCFRVMMYIFIIVYLCNSVGGVKHNRV